MDLRFALRLLSRTPLQTAIIVLILAVGIGSTTAVFSVLEAVLLRPLPYAHADRLVAIWDGHVKDQHLSKVFASDADFRTWQEHSTHFESLAAISWATGERILTGHGPAKVVLALPASVNLFDLLGAKPSTGRTFVRSDLTGGCTVVLAHRFWQNELGARPDTVGQSVTLDDQSCLVVGIMPATFEFYPQAADMWTAMTEGHSLRNGVAVFGRLKSGATLAAANAELASLHQAAEGSTDHARIFAPVIYPLQQEFTWLAGRTLRTTIFALFAAVGFVLLIACLNVSNILLGRAFAREREFAVRAALGAGRRRLVRQLLTEGLLTSAAGALLGVLLAIGAVSYFRAIEPIELPPGSELAIDRGVLAFTSLLAVITALAFGLLPAWRASQVDMAAALTASGRTAAGSALGRRVGQLLVVTEMACSVVLLVGAGLLIESLGRLGSAPLGFEPRGVLTADVRLPSDEYANPAQRSSFFTSLLDAIARNPSIGEAALSTSLMRGGGSSFLAMEGRPAPTPETAVPDVSTDAISSSYFNVMRVPLRAGRFFTDSDGELSEPVAIVNESLAHKYFRDDDPIGRRVKYGSDPNAPWLTIVGVVGNQARQSLHQEMRWIEFPVLFRPVRQVPPAAATLLVRSTVPSTDAGSAIQKITATVDGDVPVANVRLMEDILDRDLSYPRFRAVILVGFAGIATLLAVVGLYAVLSQLVAHRTREIAVRVALGAPRRAVVFFVTREGLALATTGVTLGLAVAVWLGRFMSAMLYQIRPTDPAILAIVATTSVAAACIATYVPVRRAVRIDPMVALRNE
jgi:putative ABC transport system permease protein